MEKGKPSKWTEATIDQPIGLSKAGISIVVWDKWGRKRRGTMVVSVGGVRWYPYKTKKPTQLSWEAFAEVIEEKGRFLWPAAP